MESENLNSSNATEHPGSWSREKAWQWYDRQPWLVGCNFLPSTAVNAIEMWQEETYDQQTIERELGFAENLGFNTIRVFLNFVVWQADPVGCKRRLDHFLAIAGRRSISVMLVLFDDCNFANHIAQAGPQPDPIPGVTNSQWVSSPPLSMVTEPAAWDALSRYVQDIIGTFAQDPRVVAWDLYNEVGNSGMGDKSVPLLAAAFTWAREGAPIQPLTACAWIDFESPLGQTAMELSDIVTFHSYLPPDEFRAQIALCRRFQRPVVCTEWLDRPHNNTIRDILPLLHAERVGSYQWGLVAGRTQTYYGWESKPGALEPAIWQHDLYRADGTPFDAEEIRCFKSMIASPTGSASQAPGS